MASAVISSPTDVRRFFSLRSEDRLPAGEYKVSIKNVKGYTDRFDQLTVLSDGTIKTGSGFAGNPYLWTDRLLGMGLSAHIEEVPANNQAQSDKGISTTTLIAGGAVALVALVLLARR